MTSSPQLRAIGPDIRVLAVFLDAIAAYGWYCEQVQARLDTAWLCEARSGDGWNETEPKRTMRQWGANDQHGIYAAAGLNDREAEVAFMSYDRQLEPIEIARLLHRNPVTVRTQLHRANERLAALAGTVRRPVFRSPKRQAHPERLNEAPRDEYHASNFFEDEDSNDGFLSVPHGNRLELAAVSLFPEPEELVDFTWQAER